MEGGGRKGEEGRVVQVKKDTSNHDIVPVSGNRTCNLGCTKCRLQCTEMWCRKSH